MVEVGIYAELNKQVILRCYATEHHPLYFIVAENEQKPSAI